MDNFDTTDQNSINTSGESETPIEPELSHTDKMIGIFTEPSNTYEATSKFPPRTIDWFLPVALFAFNHILITGNNDV